MEVLSRLMTVLIRIIVINHVYWGSSLVFTLEIIIETGHRRWSAPIF